MGLTKEATKRIAERNMDRRVTKINNAKMQAIAMLNKREQSEDGEHKLMTESFGNMMHAIEFVNHVNGFYMDVTIGAFKSSLHVYFFDKGVKKDILMIATETETINDVSKFTGYKVKLYSGADAMGISNMYAKEAEDNLADLLETAVITFINDYVELFKNL